MPNDRDNYVPGTLLDISTVSMVSASGSSSKIQQDVPDLGTVRDKE